MAQLSSRRGSPGPAAGPAARAEPPARRLAKLVLRVYLRGWHRFRLEGMEHVPPHGPALVVSNHTSLLDVVALMAADPFPDTLFVVKASMFAVPLVHEVMSWWNAIPVERHGRDAAGVRALMAALRDGRVAAVAPEGTRSRTGRLGPINPVLARIAVRAQVPIIPVGISGTFAALPPGGRFPRPRQVVLRVGRPFSLPLRTSVDQAARDIETAIARLLPPDQQPLR